MGGAVGVPGNATATAEANVWHDPEAADAALGAGFNLTLVGLDVTMQAILRGPHLDRLQVAEGAIPRFAWSILQHYLGAYQNYLGYRGCALHDPLAAAVLLDADLVTYDVAPVRVETQGALTRGQTVMDRRPGRPIDLDDRPPISVAMDVDVGRFLDLFLGRLDVAPLAIAE
jgi:purine nucleosidase